MNQTAFVLGGGGVLGAHEVGMLRALAEAGIKPDLIVGTSVGALNGVVLAANPADAVDRLSELWSTHIVRTAFAGSWMTRLSTLARTGTHLHPIDPLRRLLGGHLPDTFAELEVPFQCVAASIQKARAHWFTEGPLADAVLASCAVPGLLPPVRIDGEHFVDGGLVHSIPVGRAVAMGATRIFVLHVGRIERPLEPPAKPWEVGLVAFEIARRHRFAEEMASLSDDIEVHVMPAAFGGRPGLSDLRYRDASRIARHAGRAYEASAAYLADL
uniref:patatin-like phospholipase family protein n=1 Tax=Herbidospora sakaeratensis TaxID=564415 RepID=UPI000784AFB7|nr:patatin-like phospholipase family protein [Herbidospora sakaeratensis]